MSLGKSCKLDLPGVWCGTSPCRTLFWITYRCTKYSKPAHGELGSHILAKYVLSFRLVKRSRVMVLYWVVGLLLSDITRRWPFGCCDTNPWILTELMGPVSPVWIPTNEMGFFTGTKHLKLRSRWRLLQSVFCQMWRREELRAPTKRVFFIDPSSCGAPHKNLKWFKAKTKILTRHDRNRIFYSRQIQFGVII